MEYEHNFGHTLLTFIFMAKKNVKNKILTVESEYTNSQCISTPATVKHWIV